ncbi:uncharacterized protein FTOL_02899 [Fusarium torulosum]|uniref:Uncharacterized protein n=1 Tax=Fusarium torulosum TaxID=33205 RepID=A0AAE8SEQ8_9HYPO|nr:uncharacterized protein FTOL_02899 [Fusarium torulosum]
MSFLSEVTAVPATYDDTDQDANNPRYEIGENIKLRWLTDLKEMTIPVVQLFSNSTQRYYVVEHNTTDKTTSWTVGFNSDNRFWKDAYNGRDIIFWFEIYKAESTLAEDPIVMSRSFNDSVSDTDASESSSSSASDPTSSPSSGADSSSDSGISGGSLLVLLLEPLLSEPLDYINKNGLKAIQLDLVKVKATKKPFKDGAFYNPGKPVVSGLLTVVTGGVRFTEVTGNVYLLSGTRPGKI